MLGPAVTTCGHDAGTRPAAQASAVLVPLARQPDARDHVPPCVGINSRRGVWTGHSVLAMWEAWRIIVFWLMATARANMPAALRCAPPATKSLALLLLCAGLAACSFERYEPAALDEVLVPARLARASLDDPELAARLARLEQSTDGSLLPWTPARLGLVAASRSAAVSAAQAGVMAARARLALAMQRQNPQVNLAIERHTMEEDGSDSLWGVGPNINITIGPPGRRRLLGERAAIEVAVARIDVREAAWQARERAVLAALDLLAWRAQAALAARTEKRRADAETAARVLVAAGIADPFEWQTLMLEHNTARLGQLSQITAAAAARAALIAALAMPDATIDAVTLTATASSTPLPDLAGLQALALRQRPRVLRALAAYEQAEHDLALAVTAQYPSLHLNPGYFFDQGDHVWSLIGGLVVPLFASHDVAIASAAAARDSAREQFYAAQAATITALQRNYSNWEAAVAVLREVTAIVSDIEGAHALLVRKRADGVVDDLAVARAALQVAEASMQQARCAADERRTRALLESAARAAELDPPFARLLDELAASDAAAVGRAAP